jgi:hypothetical protein
MPDFGGLFSRIGSGIRSGVNKAEERIMPEPQGLEGLLSPGDIASARRQGMLDLGLSLLGDHSAHFGEALAHGIQSARGSYGNSVNQTMQQQVAGQDVRQHMNILKARQQIAQQFPPQPGEQPAQTIDRMKGMFAAYMQAGDLESAGKLGEVLKSIGKDAAPPALQHVDAGDKILVVDPRDGHTIREIPKGAAPKSGDTVAADRRYGSEQTNKILDDYRTDSAEFRKAISGYEVLKGAIAHPGMAQPFAVLDAYARVINPGAVVRQGTMQVLQEMGSYDQKMRRWIDMAQKGQWPPDMLQSIKGTIDGIMAEHYQSYQDGARKRALLRGKQAGVDITPFLENYNFAPPGAAAPAAAGGDAAKVRKLLGR